MDSGVVTAGNDYVAVVGKQDLMDRPPFVNLLFELADFDVPE